MPKQRKRMSPEEMASVMTKRQRAARSLKVAEELVQLAESRDLSIAELLSQDLHANQMHHSRGPKC